MKFLWMIACILVAMDMLPVALGHEPSALLNPDMQWLTWLPIGGWFIAAYKAATAPIAWFA